MRKGLKFHISKHMAQRAVDRELSLEAVKDVVSMPMRKKGCETGTTAASSTSLRKQILERWSLSRRLGTTIAG
jgi:hypothetical protein